MAIASRVRRPVPLVAGGLLLSLAAAGCESSSSATCFITPSVAVFLQDPATPGALKPAVLYQGYWGPLWVVIGDLNGDGKPDLVVADGSPYIRFQSPTTPGAFLPPTWLKQ